MTHQYVKPGHCASAHERTVVQIHACEFTGFLGIAGPDAFAVHVDSKGYVAKAGELFSAFHREGVETPPFMHDQNAGPFALNSVIVSQVSFKDSGSVSVLNCLGTNLGLRTAAQDNRHNKRYQISHSNPPAKAFYQFSNLSEDYIKSGVKPRLRGGDISRKFFCPSVDKTLALSYLYE